MNRNASIVLGHATYSYLNRYTEIRRNNFRPNNRSFILHSSRATCSSFNIVNRRPHTARISSAKEFLETSRQWLRRIAGVIRCYVCRTTWNSIRIASVSDTSNANTFHGTCTHTVEKEKKSFMPRNGAHVLARRNKIVLIFSTRSLEFSRNRDASVADSSIIRRVKSPSIRLLFFVFPSYGQIFRPNNRRINGPGCKLV